MVRAPGRANLLGGHTDYNEGFVLPVATAQGTYIAAAPRQDQRFCVWSSFPSAAEEFHLDDCHPDCDGPPWTAYVRGVLWALGEAGIEPPGFNAAIVGDLPVGAGVASSASVEVAVARTALALAGQELPLRRLALLCQRAENTFVGVRCGILDQYSSAFGQTGAALLVDCRSLEVKPVPIGAQDVAIVMCDTGKPRGLVESEYNARRAQCEQAAAFLGLRSLRDATLDDLQTHRASLDDTVFRRARHVVSENERVLRGSEALRRGDLSAVGALLLQAHQSLRDDYEVSCPELDAMVEISSEADGCWGARLVGAGFGGCAVAMVDAHEAEQFCRTVGERYSARTGRRGKMLVTQPSEGARVVYPSAHTPV